jgi:hypothetical protein
MICKKNKLLLNFSSTVTYRLFFNSKVAGSGLHGCRIHFLNAGRSVTGQLPSLTTFPENQLVSLCSKSSRLPKK